MRELVRVPIDLFVKKEDIARMESGDEALGYIEVDQPKDYELIDKHSIQPAIQVDNNTFKVTFILK